MELRRDTKNGTRFTKSKITYEGYALILYPDFFVRHTFGGMPILFFERRQNEQRKFESNLCVD